MIGNELYHTPGSKGGGACLCECSTEYLTTQQVGIVPEFYLYFQVLPLRFSSLVCCAWQGTKDINQMLKQAFQDGKNKQRYFSMQQFCYPPGCDQNVPIFVSPSFLCFPKKSAYQEFGTFFEGLTKGYSY